jgi:hypothetical protein
VLAADMVRRGCLWLLVVVEGMVRVAVLLRGAHNTPAARLRWWWRPCDDSNGSCTNTPRLVCV